jgi:hypothetical protein
LISLHTLVSAVAHNPVQAQWRAKISQETPPSSHERNDLLFFLIHGYQHERRSKVECAHNDTLRHKVHCNVATSPTARLKQGVTREQQHQENDKGRGEGEHGRERTIVISLPSRHTIARPAF